MVGPCLTLLAVLAGALGFAPPRALPVRPAFAGSRERATTTMLLGARARKRWDARRVAADELSIVRDRNESSLAGNATDPIVQVDTEAPGDGVVFEALEGKLYRQYENGITMPTGWTGASVRRRTGAAFEDAPTEAPPAPIATSWPVGDPRANPSIGGRLAVPAIEWFRGVRDDLRRRFLPYYWADWRDGFTTKSIGAIAFLYFAVLAPAIAFGGVMSTLTKGSLGVVEV